MSLKLASHEMTAFDILAGILKEHGPVDRDALRVLVSARGGELGRDYIRLRELGLVEEVEVRPGLFRRIFGARTARLVSLTLSGRNHAEQAATTSTVQPIDLREVALAPAASDKPADVAAPMDVVPEQILSDPIIPEPLAVTVIHEPPSPVLAPEKPKSKPAKRFATTDYTDVLGGEADDVGISVPESERLDGLAEMVGLLGFDLTPAGRLLAANRWAAGYSDGDVVLEVLVASFAHAARLSHNRTAAIDHAAMLSLIEQVSASLESLVVEGELTEGQLIESVSAMRLFLEDGDPAKEAVTAFLDDAIRGMAPPAVLPEAVWIAPGGDED